MANRTPLFSKKQPGGMFTISDLAEHPGNIWFVDSGASAASDAAGFGQDPDSPFATLDYAVGNCTANNGDVIYLMPGHAESISSATDCVLDVAGIKVIGLGWGGDRPTLTIDTATTALISIEAASVWLENLLIVSNFLNIATAITITAAGDNCTLKNIEMRNTSAVLGALIQVSVATTVTDLTVDGFVHKEYVTMTAPATNVFKFAGSYDRFTLINSHIQCFTTAAAVECSTGSGKSVYVENVQLAQAETGAGLGLAFHNSTTGYVDNIIGVNLKNGIKPVTGTGLSVGPNVRYSNAVNAYAGLYTTTVDS